jgi:hypothetical protein
MSRPTPSSLARTAAVRLWGRVQKQHRLLPGAFYFTCARRSGVVVLLEAADWLDPLAVEAARANGLLDELRPQADGCAERFEIWPGVDSSTIAPLVCASQQLRRALRAYDVAGMVAGVDWIEHLKTTSYAPFAERLEQLQSERADQLASLRIPASKRRRPSALAV